MPGDSTTRCRMLGVADHTEAPETVPTEPTAFDRFESLTRRLLGVSKDDVRKAEARDQEQQDRPPRTA